LGQEKIERQSGGRIVGVSFWGRHVAKALSRTTITKIFLKINFLLNK
jgi:hypothetical protein